MVPSHFGLRSALKIFNALADALEWSAKHNGARYFWHYLDDFITIGEPRSGECRFNIELLHHLCGRMGIPLTLDKCEGPSTCIVFLGITIDSRVMELRLPHDKLERLKEELGCWRNRKRCTKRELQSLTGSLQHAATVVKPGRTFMRRLYNLVSTAKAAGHHIYISTKKPAPIWLGGVYFWRVGMVSHYCFGRSNVLDVW